MCGIVGAWGKPASLHVREASLLQAHRGPDGDGHYVDMYSNVALSHVRLSIQDLSHLGAQPMYNEDKSVVIVFNGEIYNFRQLRSELESQGVSFRGHSDTEVLLALYLREGTAMLPKLNGIFAFVVWDKYKQEMFVARDALGVKPLYYAELAAGFVFASEIKALLPLIGSDRTIDAAALHRYFSFLWCPGEATPLKVVRKLLPGSAMVLKAGNIISSWQWYKLPVFTSVSKEIDESSAIRGTANGLRTAVNRQLVADVPVGAFLSGGLDSSAVVAMASDKVQDIRCFTIKSSSGSEEGFIDDLPYARRVASHLGLPLEIINVEAKDVVSDLKNMIYQLDEPLADPAALNVLYISQVARKNGIKVLLSGVGGDDLFTGYRRHHALSYDKILSMFPYDILKYAEAFTSKLDRRNALFRRLSKFCSGLNLSGNARLVNYFAWIQEDNLRALYSPEFKAVLGEEKAALPMIEFLAPLTECRSSLERILALEQRFFLADHNLNYTDKMSMAAGVEVRVPFLDLDFLTFANSLPDRYKQRGGVSKWVLKRAMEPYLPRDIIYREKTGFSVPLRRWMRHELRELMADVLSNVSIQRRGIFDPSAVRRLVQRNDVGQIDATYTLFSLLCVEIWFRHFVDIKT